MAPRICDCYIEDQIQCAKCRNVRTDIVLLETRIDRLREGLQDVIGKDGQYIDAGGLACARIAALCLEEDDETQKQADS